MQKLGERIRHARGRMSQEAFAGLLGISKGALGGYERGENCPNADVILTICNKCKINVSWLMSGAGAMHAPDNIDEDERPENRPAPLEDGSQTAGELSCQMAPGQDCKAENNALRAHCRWLQRTPWRETVRAAVVSSPDARSFTRAISCDCSRRASRSPRSAFFCHNSLFSLFRSRRSASSWSRRSCNQRQ